MRHRPFVLLLLLVALVAAGGCRVRDGIRRVREMKPPTTQVLAVRVAERTSEGVRLEIHVKLDNPNADALPLVAASYQVSVAGVGAAGASNRPNRTLPGSGTQTVVLPLALATPGGEALAGAAVHAGGTITYNPPGEIRMLMTESRIPLPVASFSFDGTIE